MTIQSPASQSLTMEDYWHLAREEKTQISSFGTSLRSRPFTDCLNMITRLRTWLSLTTIDFSCLLATLWTEKCLFGIWQMVISSLRCLWSHKYSPRPRDVSHGEEWWRTSNFDKRQIINSLSVEPKRWRCGNSFQRLDSLFTKLSILALTLETIFAWPFPKIKRTKSLQELPQAMSVDSMSRQSSSFSASISALWASERSKRYLQAKLLLAVAMAKYFHSI